MTVSQSPPATDYDLVVVGAGMSGLSIAQHAVAAGWKVLVLEQAERAGGCLHSLRCSEDFAGFWLELGAHSIFNSYTNLLGLLEATNGLQAVQRRRKAQFRIYADDAARSIFSQLHIWELLGALRQLWRKPCKLGRSVAEYFPPIVGQRNYRAVFEPAFSAVLSQPAADFPADALFNMRTRRKDLPRNLVLRGGLQTLVDVLSQRVNILLNQPVLEVQRRGAQFTVCTTEHSYESRAVCLATAPTVAASILHTAFPEIAALLGEIPSAMVESVGVVLPKNMLKLPPLAGLIGREQAFYSVVVRDVVPDARYRGFTFHFRPGVLDVEGQERCIARTLNLHTNWQKDAQIMRKHNQLPALRVGHRLRTQQIDDMLLGKRLALIGNYFSGVALEDCALRSQQEWQRLQREMAKP